MATTRPEVQLRPDMAVPNLTARLIGAKPYLPSSEVSKTAELRGTHHPHARVAVTAGWSDAGLMR